MLILRIGLWMFSAGVMVLGASLVSGQAYPNKPIRIVTNAAGGGADFVARLIARGLTERLPQPVVVDNRGGSGLIPGEVVSKAPADGYTLILAAVSFWVRPLLQNAPYDPVRDFAPISMVGRSPLVLVVHPSLPVRSVKELIALAKARPGALNYATGGTGSSPHIAVALFAAMAGIKIVHVPYKGGGPALIDLLSGQVQMTIDGSQLVPHIKSGKLRALAVTTLQPTALFPDLPPVAAAGVPGYESAGIYGVLAPAKTPVTLIKRLNEEIVRAIHQADVKEKFISVGVEVVGSSPEELVAKLNSEIPRWSKVIKDASIRSD